MLRIGVLMGGPSREREISFAGGRTVIDNLDRALFTPVPIFIDSRRGQPVLLDWPHLYKGTIRDFFPPTRSLPPTTLPAQVYAEQVSWPSEAGYDEVLAAVGQPLTWDSLRAHIDVAFLTLHGALGEDGALQGLLEWLGIPYTGCGIAGSALGIDKIAQRHTLQALGFDTPAWLALRVTEAVADPAGVAAAVADHVGFPCVVKHPTQGSSIGVRVVRSAAELDAAIWAVSFRTLIEPHAWHRLPRAARVEWMQRLTDVREGLSLPLELYTRDGDYLRAIHAPDELLTALDALTEPTELRAHDAPERILVEAFIEGTEFSAIVVEDEAGQPVSLPPTQILKPGEVFDYRMKYLPGQARKLTPMALPEAELSEVCQAAERLYQAAGFSVYARLDGIRAVDGRVYFNDPNTTSGMLPSSFFFHQAAEVGLSPSALLTAIIDTSLSVRQREGGALRASARAAQHRLQGYLDAKHHRSEQPQRVAVLLGGYSTERHVSVESGRNVVEKLSSSPHYAVRPLFLLHNELLSERPASLEAEVPFSLWELPLPYLLKDNADDIAQRIVHSVGRPERHAVVDDIAQRLRAVVSRVTSAQLEQPRHVRWDALSGQFDFVFLGLHGRPGEDGQVQTLLEQLGLPYNGSGPASSRLTMQKFATNETLHAGGQRIPRHRLIGRADYQADAEATLTAVERELGYPLIAKPADEGCSSAVKKIKTRDELAAFARAMLRPEGELIATTDAHTLALKQGDEFPAKGEVLVEELVSEQGARLLEVTVGVLTRRDGQGQLHYEALEPSETLATGEVLSLEEKFLAGEGQNLTPARFSTHNHEQQRISAAVRSEVARAAERLGIEGYARLDAFVRIYPDGRVEVVFIEANSLPALTPATCLFHQAALAHYTPLGLLERLIEQGIARHRQRTS